MLKRHLASFLLGLGAITPFVAQADQPAMRSQSQQKKMTPQFDMGDPIVPGQPGQPGYVPAAYNYPAGIRAPNQDWDMYFTGAFTYWKVHQDLMYTATGTNQPGPLGITSSYEGIAGSNFVGDFLYSTKPGYKPGFKVGLGWNTGSWDNWTLYGEYTWFHPGSGEDDAADDCGECGCATEVLVVPSCGCPPSFQASDLTSEWKPRLDIADLSVGRPGYQGRHLVFNPFFGLRALWIRQTWNIAYDAIASNTGNNTITPIGTYTKNSQSKAWSLGPRLGFDGSWLFGAGFRMVGNASASLLYTRYTKLNFSSNIPNGRLVSPTGVPLVDTLTWKSARSYNTVRPNFEIDAGLAWGMYVGDCYHVDLAATYDFHTFFAQNMVATLENSAFRVQDTAPGNMYIHGLTVKARFDF